MRHVDKAWEEIYVVKRYITSCETEEHVEVARKILINYVKEYETSALGACIILETLWTSVRSAIVKDNAPVIFGTRFYRYFNT